MTSLPLFLLAVVSVLATPGPTNALLTTSAALVGTRRSLPLVTAELAGYALSIGVLLAASGAIVAAVPWLGLVIRAALVLYLLWLAWHLWDAGGGIVEASLRVVTWRRVFVTTLLNPKGPIFAFAVFPPLAGPRAIALYGGLFAATTLAVALGWMMVGATLGRLADNGRRTWLPRITAVVLVVFACLVVVSATTK
jgi:threonine/homoserine/homoserine lactone efflux protein